mgnify:CR=1 FL=1
MVEVLGSPAVRVLAARRGIAAGQPLPGEGREAWHLFLAGRKPVALPHRELPDPPFWGAVVGCPLLLSEAQPEGAVVVLSPRAEPCGHMVSLSRAMARALQLGWNPAGGDGGALGEDRGAGEAERRSKALGAPSLTPRQLEVLRLMAYGHSYRRIAELLRLSPETVRTFIRQIYDRLGVSSKADCLMAAYERGLLLNPDSPVLPKFWYRRFP